MRKIALLLLFSIVALAPTATEAGEFEITRSSAISLVATSPPFTRVRTRT